MSQISRAVRIIVLFGGPGAGKGTFVERLKKLITDLIHLECGRLLRDDPVLKAEYLDRGQFAPDEIVIKMITALLQPIVESASTRFVILDGFPRTDIQMTALFEMCEQWGIAPPTIVFLKADDEIFLARIAERRQKDIQAGRTPRDDDHPDIAPKRVQKYNETVVGLLEHPRLSRDDLFEADASQSADHVFIEVGGFFVQKGFATREELLLTG